MSVTQQDIADKIGVSRRLVSYALNDEAGVGADMRARILDIAGELGYRTNRAAKTLVTGRTYQIALCVPTLSVPFHTQFIQHFEAAARHTEYDLLVYATLDNSRPLPAVDGIIMHGSRSPEDTSKPIVLIESPPCYPISVDKINADRVTLSLTAASEAALKHLLELKKPRVAHVTYNTLLMSIEPRYQAYCNAMKQAQLPPEIISFNFHWNLDVRDQAHRILEDYFQSHGVPDALFCCNDEVAIGAYRALRALGRKVPDETAIIGCDNVPETRDLVPSLTTIRHAWDDVCRCAWDLLTERIENPSLPLRERIFPGELVVRDSSGPQRIEL